MRWREDKGSVALLLIGGFSAALFLIGLLGATSLYVRAQSLQITAAHAALEAADTLSGRLPGAACDRAAAVAKAAHVGMTSCVIVDHDARVGVSSGTGVFTLKSRAHAGPPRHADNLTSR